MDEDLKHYLDQKFSGLEQGLDQKFSEIDRRFSEIDRRFSALEQKLVELRDEIRTEIEALETKLLSEFWKWGRSADQRIRRMENSDATTVERLASMEERIFTLERKVAGGKG